MLDSEVLLQPQELDLENIASRVHAGWVENVVDSTRFDRIVTNRSPLCRFVIPEVDSRET